MGSKRGGGHPTLVSGVPDMYVLFTDLDGTLLDHETYSWEAARPAIQQLEDRHIPWILVTSKTRVEVEHIRHDLGHHHPFIVENGAAAYIPRGYFPFAIAATARIGYDVLEWGTPYERLVAGLRDAARQAGCRVCGFHEMSAAEIVAASGLRIEEAIRAKQREYDEPFQILDPGRSGDLLAALEAQGLRWTRGGRFYHACGDNDKARAVAALCDLFVRLGEPVVTIGLGDGLNDAPFLDIVEIPVLIRSGFSAVLKHRVPRGSVTERPGPEGWNQAVLSLVAG